jgi:hypothetical protein
MAPMSIAFAASRSFLIVLIAIAFVSSSISIVPTAFTTTGRCRLNVYDAGSYRGITVTGENQHMGSIASHQRQTAELGLPVFVC